MECEPGPQHVPGLGRFQEGPPPWGTGHTLLTLHSSWSISSWRRLTWSRHCISASELGPGGGGPGGKPGWKVSRDELRGSGGAGTGGPGERRACSGPSSASPPTPPQAHLHWRRQETRWRNDGRSVKPCVLPASRHGACSAPPLSLPLT